MRKYLPFLLGITLALAGPITASAYTISNVDPSDPGNSDAPLAVKGATGTFQNAAAPITTTGAGTVSTVSLCVAKNGNPVDNAVLSIYSDSAGAPGSDLGDSTGVAGSTLTSSGAFNDCSSGGANFVTFTFSSPVSLSASTNYWLFLGRSGTRSTSSYYFFLGSTHTVTGFGPMLYSNSGTWSSAGAEGFYSLTITPSGGGGGGGGGPGLFTPSPGTGIIGTSTMAAAVGALPTDLHSTIDSVWVLFAIALSIPLAFWITRRIQIMFLVRGSLGYNKLDAGERKKLLKHWEHVDRETARSARKSYNRHRKSREGRILGL